MIMSRMNRKNGFTLIEAVITISIISIFSAMLLPSYTYHLDRKNQAECDLGANKIYQSITNYMMTAMFRTKHKYPMVAKKKDDEGVIKNDFTVYEFLYVIERMLLELKMNVQGDFDYQDVVLTDEQRSGIYMVGLDFKDNQRIHFYFEVFDYDDLDHDMAFLRYFEYFGSNGYSTILNI